MKLKLAGLLLFSQAAEAVIGVDRTNYQQKLCDDNIFKAVSTEDNLGSRPEHERQCSNAIKMSLSDYCSQEKQYSTAVKWSEGTNNPIDEHLAEIAGIKLAQTCEKIRKLSAPLGECKYVWDVVVPRIPKCFRAQTHSPTSVSPTSVSPSYRA